MKKKMRFVDLTRNRAAAVQILHSQNCVCLGQNRLQDESMSFIIDAFNDLGVASRPSGSREARAMAQEEASSASSRGGRFEASSYSKEKAHLVDNKTTQRQKPPTKVSKEVLERQRFASQLVMKSCMKDFRNYR